MAEDNQPEFFKFDLKNETIGSVVKQPELVLPNGNSYALRIESDLSIDIPGVTENFIAKVDAAIDSVIAEVTNSPLDGRTLLEQKGLNIDPLAIANSSDVFLLSNILPLSEDNLLISRIITWLPLSI